MDQFKTIRKAVQDCINLEVSSRRCFIYSESDSVDDTYGLNLYFLESFEYKGLGQIPITAEMVNRSIQRRGIGATIILKVENTDWFRIDAIQPLFLIDGEEWLYKYEDEHFIYFYHADEYVTYIMREDEDE
ncbi:MAG: hypothetical protein WCQ32_00200 [bacterium]